MSSNWGNRGYNTSVNNYKSSFDILREQRLAAQNQSTPSAGRETPSGFYDHTPSPLERSRYEVLHNPISMAVQSGIEEPPYYTRAPPTPAVRPQLDLMTRDDLYNECAKLRWSFDNAQELRERSEQGRIYYRDLVAKYQAEKDLLNSRLQSAIEAKSRAEEETGNYRRSCESLRNQLNDLEEEFRRAKLDLDRAHADLRGQFLLEGEQGGAQVVVGRMKEDLREKDACIVDLSRQNSELEAELERLRNALSPADQAAQPPASLSEYPRSTYDNDPLARQRLEDELQAAREELDQLRNTLDDERTAAERELQHARSESSQMGHKELENALRNSDALQETIDQLAAELAKRAPVSLSDWEDYQQKYSDLLQKNKQSESTVRQLERQLENGPTPNEEELAINENKDQLIQTYSEEVELRAKKEEALHQELETVSAQLQQSTKEQERLARVQKNRIVELEISEKDLKEANKKLEEEIAEKENALVDAAAATKRLGQELDASEQEKRDLEEQLRELQKQSSDDQKADEEIRRLQAALDELADRVGDEDIDELQQQLDERTAELEAEVARNRDLAANGRTLEAEIVELNSQVAALESRLAAKETEVGVSSQQSEAAVVGLEQELANAAEAVERISQALDASEQEKRDLEAQLRELQKQSSNNQKGC
ncbi:hypothetical protein, conserved [Angomonas deanei]|uniref:Uncharacterized protein n=1 Tax=Angomonas deanei TaxID=59799 RepID=A0A7G2CR43_9TRYP|nr:hypothetical protein, conserved [Angomonas deanei]